MLEVSLQELVFAHRSHLSLLIFLLFYYQAVWSGHVESFLFWPSQVRICFLMRLLLCLSAWLMAWERFPSA
jgi:hypothetical protein